MSSAHAWLPPPSKWVKPPGPPPAPQGGDTCGQGAHSPAVVYFRCTRFWSAQPVLEPTTQWVRASSPAWEPGADGAPRGLGLSFQQLAWWAAKNKTDAPHGGEEAASTEAPPSSSGRPISLGGGWGCSPGCGNFSQTCLLGLSSVLSFPWSACIFHLVLVVLLPLSLQNLQKFLIITQNMANYLFICFLRRKDRSPNLHMMSERRVVLRTPKLCKYCRIY